MRREVIDRPYGVDACDDCAGEILESTEIIETEQGVFCSEECAERVRVDAERFEP
jgi:hypothetical protein